jgi:hypothetical protein
MKTSLAFLALLSLTAAQFGKGKGKGGMGGFGKKGGGKSGGGAADLMAWYVRDYLDLLFKHILIVAA